MGIANRHPVRSSPTDMNWRFRELSRRVFPGCLSALTIAVASAVGLLEPLEHVGYNALFNLRGERAWDDRVVVIAIDDATMRQLGQFPFPRYQYIHLLKTLTKAESGPVVFDILWIEPHPADAALAVAVEQHRQVILAQGWDNTGLPLLPQRRFVKAALESGHIFKEEDADGISRQLKPQFKGILALSIQALEAYNATTGATSLPNLNQPLRINWLRRSRHIPSYSFVDVVQGKVPAAALRNKIVVVGMTAAGLDALDTPFDRNPPSNGVYLQATVLANLLQRNLLQKVDFGWFILGLCGIAPGLSWWLNRCKVGDQLLISGSGCVAWMGLSLFVFHFNYWIPTITPVLLIVGTTAAVVIYERLQMNHLLQNQVQRLWSTYRQDVVTEVVRAPEVPPPTWRRQPVSMERAGQLAKLAEQFGRSQSAQAAISRSLSSGLLAADGDGKVWFCNPVASQLLHISSGDWLPLKLIPHWLTSEQWQTALQALNRLETSAVIEVCQGDRWFDVKLEPMVYKQPQTLLVEADGLPSPVLPTVDASPLSGFLLVLEEITERKQAAIAQAQLNQQLLERTMQLEVLNQELESFSYAVSHDLRAPLRRIEGFSHLLLEESTPFLDEAGLMYLSRIQFSVTHMGNLIEDLLNLSRIVRTVMHRTDVDLSLIVTTIAEDLRQTQLDRDVKFIIAPDVTVNADPNLLSIAIENLLNNAWKYTSKCIHPEIEFGVLTQNSTPVFFIRDNGVGFDMAHADRLFRAFQRLHTAEEFPGNGVGLMTTQRIIHRHNGRIWADAQVNQGATFYFTLQIDSQRLVHLGGEDGSE
jgi:signal transduction histidine kinase